jgi:uncharacterized protein (DUF58 family)
VSALPIIFGAVGGFEGYQFFGWLGAIFGIILGAILIVPIGWIVLWINHMRVNSKN